MHDEDLERLRHDHTFEQDRRRPGESRTLVVILLTAVTMIVEVVAGIHYGSMALLADGLHMGSHAVALGITAFAYAYARRNARDSRFSFGTGKVNALGGFSGAILLAVFALYMAFESVARLIEPVAIAFDQAIAVAVIGLLVNGASVWILGAEGHDHHHGHDLDHRLDHGHDHHGPPHGAGHDHLHHEDQNLKSAYLHVLADALTSVLAIVALLSAKYLGLVFMDPLMGVVGAVLVARWSLGLLSSTSAILLDHQASDAALTSIRTAVEEDGDSRVTDLHVWAIGPGIYAAQIAVVGRAPASADAYRARIPSHLGVVHALVEVRQSG